MPASLNVSIESLATLAELRHLSKIKEHLIKGFRHFRFVFALKIAQGPFLNGPRTVDPFVAYLCFSETEEYAAQLSLNFKFEGQALVRRAVAGVATCVLNIVQVLFRRSEANLFEGARQLLLFLLTRLMAPLFRYLEVNPILNELFYFFIEPSRQLLTYVIGQLRADANKWFLHFGIGRAHV